MAVKLTDEQRQAVETRNKDILVSAAAGSGKTMVLVERVMSRLCDKKDPIDVDELLIVTFTEAAAAQMKEKLREAIAKKLDADPYNDRLTRQEALICRAQITTVHGFCLSVIKEYFHTIDLDPSFRVADDAEIDLLKRDVLDEVLEERYAGADDDFVNLTESFDAKNNDENLQDVILRLYEYAESYPDPDDYLSSCVNLYGISNEKEFEEAPFVRETVRLAKAAAADAKENLGRALKICMEEDGPLKYKDIIESEMKFADSITRKDTFAEIRGLLKSFSFERLNSGRSDKTDAEKKSLVQSIRNECKDNITSLKDDFFFEDTDDIISDFKTALSNAVTLIDVVRDFATAFEAKKRSRGIIDFGDMEHLALRILTRKEDGELIPTPAALEYRSEFAEVMVDEYQDSNYVQEAVLNAVSSSESGRHNLFMVGDVKQSIYGFRRARPELFTQKYKSFGDGGEEHVRIDLSRNFRSRSEVINFTNFIFRRVMTCDFGGIGYDDKAALYPGASYEDTGGNEPEVLLVDLKDFDGSESAKEIEAYAVAKKIRSLAGNYTVYDKEKDIYRPAKYGDIVILMRNLKGWGDIFEKVLNDEGIPAQSVVTEGYFNTREVAGMLDYLRIVDNPRQDIPLTAVLSGPFVGLSADELALIRTKKEGSFYECVFDYAKNGSEAPLREKLASFLDTLYSFREKSPYTPIRLLIDEISDLTGYGDYVAALPSGTQRSANLKMLSLMAVKYESTGYKGLFNFVRYIGELQKYEIDRGGADTADAADNAVRIMTIHKSKGLEFPIVFLCAAEASFGGKDNKQQVLMHSALGLGIDAVNIKTREKAPTLIKNVIKKAIKDENAAEELRILYVAMTRAREKLIITGAARDLKKSVDGWRMSAPDKSAALREAKISGAARYLDWIMPALLCGRIRDDSAGRGREYAAGEYGAFMNPRGADTGTDANSDANANSDAGSDSDTDADNRGSCYLIYSGEGTEVGCENEKCLCKVSVITSRDLAAASEREKKVSFLSAAALSSLSADKVYDRRMREQIKEQFSYKYPYEEDVGARQKFTVSELKKRLYMEEDEIEEEEVIPLLPKFAGTEKKTLPGERGTACHRVLELLDFTADYDYDKLEGAIDEMSNKGLLFRDALSDADIADILAFTRSDAGERVKSAARAGALKREQPFVIDDGKRLVQGIIDAFFEEDGYLTVLDYKTDRIFDEDKFREKYGLQLDYYAMALSRVTGKTVREKIIYSLAMRREIKM